MLVALLLLMGRLVAPSLSAVAPARLVPVRWTSLSACTAAGASSLGSALKLVALVAIPSGVVIWIVPTPALSGTLATTLVAVGVPVMVAATPLN